MLSLLQRRARVAARHSDRADGDAIALGVSHWLRRHAKAHRLAVEQPGQQDTHPIEESDIACQATPAPTRATGGSHNPVDRR